MLSPVPFPKLYLLYLHQSIDSYTTIAGIKSPVDRPHDPLHFSPPVLECSRPATLSSISRQRPSSLGTWALIHGKIETHGRIGRRCEQSTHPYPIPERPHYPVRFITVVLIVGDGGSDTIKSNCVFLLSSASSSNRQQSSSSTLDSFVQ